MIQLQHPFGKERTQNLSILVLGLGESGAAMARWCVTQGATVSIVDTRSENQLSEGAKKYHQAVKDLGGMGVEPQESQTSTTHSPAENHQFTSTWNVRK